MKNSFIPKFKVFKSQSYRPIDVVEKTYNESVIFIGDYHALTNCFFNGPVVIVTDKPEEVRADNSLYVEPIRYVSQTPLKTIIKKLKKLAQ